MAWHGRFKGLACGAALACVVVGGATGTVGDAGHGDTAVPSCLAGTAAARPTQVWPPGQPRGHDEPARGTPRPTQVWATGQPKSAVRLARTPEPQTLVWSPGQPRG